MMSTAESAQTERRMNEVRDLTEESMESFGIHGAEKFVLRELLGEGGFGTVYRCTLQPQKQCSTSSFVLYVDKDRSGLLSECADILKEQRCDVRDAQINSEVGCERAVHTYSVVDSTTGHSLSFARLLEVQGAFSRVEFVRCMIKEGDMELDRGDAANFHASHASDDAIESAYAVTVRNNDTSEQPFTSVTVEGPDMNGLVSSITSALDAASLSIQKFHGGHVEDSPGYVRDVFHVTRDGKQVPECETEALADRLRVVASTLISDGAQDFAVKVVNARRLALISGCSLESVCPIVQREVEVLNHLGAHPRLVQLHYAFYSKGSSRFYLVSELVLGGDLFSAIVRRGKAFNEPEARILLTQLSEAIAFCHSRQVAHRDLKLENCLLEAPDSLSVKVCDYGQSKFFGLRDLANATTLTTSPAYTAPEVMQAIQNAKPYDAYKADVFSLGVVLYCLLCNALPVDVGKRLYEHHRAWPGLSQMVRNLIGKLLAANADLRPQAKDVLQDEWIHTPMHELSANMPAHNSPSSIAGPSLCAGHVYGREHAKCALEALVQVQLLVDGLQRERVSCVSSSTLDELPYYWYSRSSDEHFQRADQRVSLTIKKFEAENANMWTDLQFELRLCASQVVGLRTSAYNIIRSPASELGQDQTDARLISVFMAYHPLLSRLISAMVGVLPLLRSFSYAAAAANDPTRIEIRLRVLALASEQLARERGFLAAYFKEPNLLRSIPAVLSLAEIIGARKLLVGVAESAPGSEDAFVNPETNVVASSNGGLCCAIQLTETSPLEIKELLALDRFEKSFFSTCDDAVNKGAVADWWHLLLSLADKFHTCMVMGFMELLCHDPSDE